MRIAISGSACQGKSTLVNDFLKNWPNYNRSQESYRNVVKQKNLPLNKEATKESQLEILKCILADLKSTSKNDNVIFDRCCLDNIVYSLWANAKSTSDIDDDFIRECIPLVHESMSYLDIIFFLPITKLSPIVVEEKELRETDQEYIKEIDNIFKSISYGLTQTGKSPFFPEEDRPPIIEIFGSPIERIEMIKLYVAPSGDLVDEGSVFSSQSLKEMEQLLGVQEVLYKEEKEINKIKEEVTRKDK
jgi:predicted ATPase